MLERLAVGRKLIVALAGILLIVLTGTAITLWSLLSLSERGITIGERLHPLGTAAQRIVIAATDAHLIMEEVMGGDSAESVDEVYAYLDEARAYANAILAGGTVQGLTVVGSTSEAVQQQMQRVLTELATFHDAVANRYELLSDDQGVGSDADEAFDTLYETLAADLAGLADSLAGDARTQQLIGEARYRLAHGHLLLAEILGGDAGESFDEVTASFDAARQAISDLPFATSQTAQVIDGIETLSSLAESRHDSTLARQRTLLSADVVFDAAFTHFVETTDRARELIRAEIEAGTQAVRDMRNIALITGCVAGLLLLATFALAYRMLDQQISQRLTVLARVMRELLQGNLDAEAPHWRTEDEVGVLRDSVDELRAALLRQRELEEEASRAKARTEEHARAAARQSDLAEEARKAAEREREATAERAAAAEAFAGDFSRIAARAREGFFDVRMSEELADDHFRALAAGMNAILATVEAGLADTGRVLHGIVQGDLSQRMKGRYSGEFARLQNDVNATMERLDSLVSQILTTADTIAQETGAIATNARDLSARAEHQAATVEQTSAAMEQMSDNVKSNAGNAESAGTIARTATESAERGGAVVNKAIEAMDRIEARSGDIRKIVEVIDSIAFQTNLLALNAGVEAARAGEAGKGFAVVATEVRGLARSATEAAKDINDLIETSNKEVAEGSRLVNDSGEALSQIVSSVTNISSRVAEISLASRDLATGVSEVSAAVGSIDTTTQVTASLAVESADAAAQLAERAADLRDLVSFFNMSPAPARKGPSRLRA